MTSRPASGVRARVRWGFGDAVWIAVAGFVAGNVGGAISLVVRHPPATRQHPLHTDALDTLWGGLAQFAAMLAIAFLVLAVKGHRGARDVGLDRPTWRDGRYLAGGLGLAFAITAVIALPSKLWSDAGHGKQEIGNQLQHANGLTTIILVVLIAVVAPFTEELLFRGVVLRSALRRMPAAPAVLVSGLSFGLFHLVDIDTLPALTGLAAVGCVSAIVAVRTGRLMPSVCLHAGFNAIGVVQLLATRH